MRSSVSIYRVEPTIRCPYCLRPQSSLALDRAPPSARSAFVRAQKIEREYTKRLRSLARNVASLLRGFDLTGAIGWQAAQDALRRYATALTPWATAVGNRMVAEVAQRDERSWFKIADQMGSAIKAEIASAPIGHVMQARMAEQVNLITSLPREAAERVHELTVQGIAKGWRAERIADEIMKIGDITRSRANLIARTEVGRTATLLTQARAEYVGSEGYIWRTAQDSDVRASHKAMQGKFVRWDDPPTLDGLTGHAGAIPNCRCYPEPTGLD